MEHKTSSLYLSLAPIINQINLFHALSYCLICMVREKYKLSLCRPRKYKGKRRYRYTNSWPWRDMAVSGKFQATTGFLPRKDASCLPNTFFNSHSSPCCEFCILSFGCFGRRLNFICRRFGTPCLFHLHMWCTGTRMSGYLYGSSPLFFLITSPMIME